MSSHHIVRDNQEPALLILEAVTVPFEIVQELLEWSPSVMVDESQLDTLLRWGIKIDMVLFQEKNKEEIIEKVSEQFPIKLLSCQAHEDVLTMALHFLRSGKYPSVNILTHQRTIFHYLLSFESEINMVVIQDKIRWSLVRSGYFEKRVADHSMTFVLENNLNKLIIPDPENKIRIKKESPFWVGEQL